MKNFKSFLSLGTLIVGGLFLSACGNTGTANGAFTGTSSNGQAGQGQATVKSIVWQVSGAANYNCTITQSGANFTVGSTTLTSGNAPSAYQFLNSIFMGTDGLVSQGVNWATYPNSLSVTETDPSGTPYTITNPGSADGNTAGFSALATFISSNCVN